MARGRGKLEGCTDVPEDTSPSHPLHLLEIIQQASFRHTCAVFEILLRALDQIQCDECAVKFFSDCAEDLIEY